MRQTRPGVWHAGRAVGVLWMLSATVAFANESVRLGATEEFRWQGWVNAGLAVEVNGISGNVRAEWIPGDEVEVIALKHGGDALDDVSIEVIEHEGGVTFCAVYAGADPDRPYECRPTDGGGYRVASASDSFARVRYEGGGGGDVRLDGVRVDFIVRIPANVRFIGRTVNGQIETESLSDVEAYNVLGDILVDMPPKPDSDVHVESALGAVTSDFPLHYERRRSGTWARATLGHGRKLLKLATTSGSIHLRRGGRT